MKHVPFCLCLLLVPVGVPAADAEAVIRASGGHYAGRQAVNQAAGQLNQQSNQIAISSAETGQALAGVHAGKSGSAAAGDVDVLSANHYRATIDGGSFRNGVGVLQINQVSGAFNQSGNQMALAVGPRADAVMSSATRFGVVDDAVLAGTTSAPPEDASSGAPASGGRQVTMDAGSFQNLGGVVQVNQVAGNGNQVGNGIALAVHAP